MSKYLSILLLLLGFYTTLFADVNQHKEALLQQLAASSQDTGRLNILYELVIASDQVPLEQTNYINQLLEEAKKQNNNFYKCRAYLHHMFQAYNQYDSEGVNQWMKFLEPLARKEKLYDMLFRGKQCVVDMLLVNEQYELQLKEANLMLKEAKEVENINGQISAYQSMAHVYGATYQKDKAFEMLEKAIQLGPQSNNQLLFGEVVRTMTLVCEDIRDYPNWKKYLQLQDSLIGCSEKEFPMESFNDLRMLNCISFLKYHIRLKQWDKAETYLSLIDQYYSEDYILAYKYNYLIAKSYYFLNVKEWSKALVTVDKILELIKDASQLMYAKQLTVKAALLKELGREKEALVIYKEAKVLRDTLSLEIIDKQANQLKKTYQADLQVLSEAEQKQRIQQILLILAGIIILILVMSIVHAYHIKRKLMKAEQVMQTMMDETEQANRIKERFLSNINMTIRPPLEIIVNNSARLASDEQIHQEEKEQLSTLITSTSTELMTLINDILLLSKLEAGMMRFMIQEVDVIRLVADVAGGVVHLYPDSVSVETSGLVEYRIKGDESYLKQVISSVCNVTGATARRIRIEMAIEGEGGVTIKFVNSVLASDLSRQDFFIRNEINRMIVECFQGKYSVDAESEEPVILLHFVSNVEPSVQQ